MPEADVTRVRRWCRNRIPDHARDRVRIECEAAGRDVTVVECQRARGLVSDQEWMRSPVARLRYLKSRGVWTLYWRDRDEKWHPYREVPPSPAIDDLLREVDRDPTAIFWG